ncbi:butyrophilin subfamily 3 member A2-like isoform X2 [Betta splendens]|uniref:Butyrophilin subfamily 3 member A2-like isoform X2 n=1 Tax=Betta splendens TaxID=158456 RepID=A0A9W2Y6M4_BETSP|nr:butyrophilin subfamily 3 member A2-like isoform X2 [Betta splendens]
MIKSSCKHSERLHLSQPTNTYHLPHVQNSRLFPLRVWILCLLLRCCSGDSELIGSSQPIVARVGDDVTLPCHLEPALDVDMTALEWTRPDLNQFVYVWRSGQELVNDIHPSYRGRTSMFSDQLKEGNMSLKLSEVELSDRGTYRCFIPKLSKQALVTLIVAPDAVSSPVISLSGLDRDRGGVVLECRSGGWFPEPELLWLDAEGKLLSAGPTETVRGSDDLYTVSSRVTVDKRHSSRYTCRVQQTSINHTSEAHIEVTDDFFNFPSSLFAATVGLSVAFAVCILFILLLLLLFFNIIRCKICERDENCGKRKIIDHFKHRREKTERVKTLKDELKNKNNEVQQKQTELQRLQQEEENREKILQSVKKELDTRNNEDQQRREEPEKRVKTLREELKTKKEQVQDQQRPEGSEWIMQMLREELDAKRKEVQQKQSELQQLQDEKEKLQQRVMKEELKKREDDQPDSEGERLHVSEEPEQAAGWMSYLQAVIHWFRGI